MYELFNSGGVWEFHHSRGCYKGSLSELITTMTKPRRRGGFGFDIEEIEFAIEEMFERKHSAAHFGVLKSFMFSFQKERSLDSAFLNSLM